MDTATLVKEKNMALDRRKTFRMGILVIIPVRIDDSPMLYEFRDIQAIALTDKTGQHRSATIHMYHMIVFHQHAMTPVDSGQIF